MRIGVIGVPGAWGGQPARGAGPEGGAGGRRRAAWPPGRGQGPGGCSPTSIQSGSTPAMTTRRHCVRTAEAVIEFSTPAATLANAALCAEAGCAHVVGTTGLSPEQERAWRTRGAHRDRLAPNMSLGVNLLLGLVEQVARALDPAFDVEILEMHHRLKVDAPSGTALALGRAAARGRGVELDAVASGHATESPGSGQRARSASRVLRGGDVVGEHKVVFAGIGERSSSPMSRPTGRSTPAARSAPPGGPRASRRALRAWPTSRPAVASRAA